MDEVVLTRQELDQNQRMVIIRHQPFSKFMGRSGDVEMPVSPDRVDQLHDLRDILRPRMQSTAPSAMESVHRDVSSTPPESQSFEEIHPDSLDNQLQHNAQGGVEVGGAGDTQGGSEGTYSINHSQEHNSCEPTQDDSFDPPQESDPSNPPEHDSFNTSTQNNSFDEHDGFNGPHSSPFDDPDQTFFGPDIDNSNGLRFSEPDGENIDEENRSSPSMMDSEDNIVPLKSVGHTLQALQSRIFFLLTHNYILPPPTLNQRSIILSNSAMHSSVNGPFQPLNTFSIILRLIGTLSKPGSTLPHP